jgi:hypothetical protein
MIAARDNCRARRRAERRGVEVGVAQSLPRDAIHGGSGYDPAEGAWCAETLIIRHDEQHVGRALRRHDARRPPRRRLRGFLLDHTAEFRIGRRKLLSVDSGGGARRTLDTCDLLSQCRDATEGEKTCGGKQTATDFHGRKLPLSAWQKRLAHFGGKMIVSSEPHFDSRQTCRLDKRSLCLSG